LKASAAVAGVDYRSGEVVVRKAGQADPQVVKVHGSVDQAVKRLAHKPGVVSVNRNWIARAAYVPNDPGRPGGAPGDWQTLQWNFLPGIAGVDAPAAWDNLIADGHPGGRGVTVAVLDTGVAYRRLGRYRRDPDMTRRIKAGYDFVGHDHYSVDENGHGTHVASTIAEKVNNGVGVTGLAYGVRIMPVRVLNRNGEGDSAAIAKGIHYAAKHGAQIINLSFEFGAGITRRQIPDILSALRYAYRRNVLVVAAAGNAGRSAIAYPARATHVLSVGAITQHGCVADYSDTGTGLDLVAPGGGFDAYLRDDPNCHPDAAPGGDIYQMTFTGSVRRFGLPRDYVGTSMAAPHVSATAALVIASGVIGAHPSVNALIRRLKETADDLGDPGPDKRYGWGKVDAARATAPAASG
jgi:serine protease